MMLKFLCHFCTDTFPADPMAPFCPQCREPLLVELPSAGRRIHSSGPPLERFMEFLPLSGAYESLSLGEGDSPLLPLIRLQHKFELPSVWAKDEMLNPTGSFKDRGTVVAVHRAKDSGVRKIGTVSTGNMGASTAAYGARAGMQVFVLAKEDTPREKLLSAGVHGAHLVQIRGDYGELFLKSYRVGSRHGIYFMNSTDPFRIEGYKIIGFEIYEQLRPRLPHYIFVPVSSGGHLIGLMKAFIELSRAGIIPSLPVFIGVQAQGCSPIAQAFSSGRARVSRVAAPGSVAQSINNPSPPGGNLLLHMLREHDGAVTAVTDEEILTAQRILAREEGLFCLPASATVLAGMLKIRDEGRFRPDDRVVLVITGSGFKNIPVLEHQALSLHSATPASLDALIASL
jgi:threonine synthase